MHAGVRDVARDLARRNIAAFAAGEFDAVVTNAAGCGSALKDYGRLFAFAEPEHDAASAFAKSVRDVTEFLAALGLSAPLKEISARVTYQDSCHLLHGQKIREAPAPANPRHSGGRMSGTALFGHLLRFGGRL